MTRKSDLQYLLNEERFLNDQIKYLKDQLYRLQVEELSLKSLIRNKNVENMKKELPVIKKKESEKTHTNDEVLNLDVATFSRNLAEAGIEFDIEVDE